MFRDTKYILGIDEAGRGPVIGPLVIIGVVIRSDMIPILSKFVRYDSKKYSREKRFELRLTIEKYIEEEVIKIITPREIDDWIINNGGLNELEAFYFAEIIYETLQKYGDIEIILDACDPKPEKFINRIERHLKIQLNRGKLICVHKADEKYLPVAVASILAKTVRDKEMDRLNQLYGEIGSGYPIDKRTMDFLKERINDDTVSNIIRWTWKTVKNLKK